MLSKTFVMYLGGCYMVTHGNRLDRGMEILKADVLRLLEILFFGIGGWSTDVKMVYSWSVPSYALVIGWRSGWLFVQQ